MVKRASFAIYIHNMRRSKLTEDEILKAEKAKDDRQHSRAKGFSKMKERDAGVAQLSNGMYMLWPPRAPEGKFVLKRPCEQGEIFDAEEFRRNLRWV